MVHAMNNNWFIYLFSIQNCGCHMVNCYLTLDFLSQDSAVYEIAAVYWCHSTAFLFSNLNLNTKEGKGLFELHFCTRFWCGFWVLVLGFFCILEVSHWKLELHWNNSLAYEQYEWHCLQYWIISFVGNLAFLFVLLLKMAVLTSLLLGYSICICVCI